MNGTRDPWDGLVPMRPPAQLRARVLTAAREQPPAGLVAALFDDRSLRRCAAGLAALVLANALVAGGRHPRGPIAAPVAYRADDTALPGDAGLTAAEQFDDLAPVLGAAIARSRG